MPDGRVTPAMVDEQRLATLAKMTDAELANVLERLLGPRLLSGERLIVTSAVARLRRAAGGAFPLPGRR